MKTNKTEKPTHTPGPWKKEGDAIWADHMNGSRLICRMKGLYRVPDTFDADASLIAAAPQLLALVKQYRQEAISQGADVSDVQEIDKVLRLAGEDI